MENGLRDQLVLIVVGTFIYLIKLMCNIYQLDRATDKIIAFLTNQDFVDELESRNQKGITINISLILFDKGLIPFFAISG